jgi:hypothetical protein
MLWTATSPMLAPAVGRRHHPKLSTIFEKQLLPFYEAEQIRFSRNLSTKDLTK